MGLVFKLIGFVTTTNGEAQPPVPRRDPLPLGAVPDFRFTFESSDVVVAELSDGKFTGRGEAAGVYYLGDDLQHIVAEIEAHRDAIEDRPIAKSCVTSCLPGALNAIDCAMWDLEAKREGVEAHRLACVDKPQPLITTFTLGADEPEVMAEGARADAGARAIEVKLTGELELDVGRVAAIRAAAPMSGSALTPTRASRGISLIRSSTHSAPIVCHFSSSRFRAVARPTWMATAARSRSRPTKAP